LRFLFRNTVFGGETGNIFDGINGFESKYRGALNEKNMKDVKSEKGTAEVSHGGLTRRR